MPNKQFYTKSEVARLLRVKPRTIERYRKRGRVMAVNIGGRALFPVAQFDHLLNTPAQHAA